MYVCMYIYEDLFFKIVSLQLKSKYIVLLPIFYHISFDASDFPQDNALTCKHAQLETQIYFMCHTKRQ